MRQTEPSFRTGVKTLLKRFRTGTKRTKEQLEEGQAGDLRDSRAPVSPGCGVS